MKNKIITAWLLICGVFIVYTNSFAQILDYPIREESSSNKELTVAAMIKTSPPLVSDEEMMNLLPLLRMDNKNNSYFQRLILDRKNKLSYEYSLEVVAIEGSDKFRVRFKAGNLLSTMSQTLENHKKSLIEQQSKEPARNLTEAINGAENFASIFRGYTTNPLPKYPDEITVSEGDTIVLDILKDPQTGMTIQDLIRVIKGDKPEGNFWDVGEARSFSLADVQFNFQKCKIYINGILSNPPPYPDYPGVSFRGSWGILYTPRGKFLFYPSPNEKYSLEKVGVIENDTIIISQQGDTIKVVSEVPILGKPGKWILWGKFRPQSKTNKDFVRIYAGDYLYMNWIK